MTKTTRARYTLEFKEEAVSLVKGGERQATFATATVSRFAPPMRLVISEKDSACTFSARSY
jgi:transposase-like protein